MIKKCAEAEVLRKAFPIQTGGLRCAEEMHERDHTRTITTAATLLTDGRSAEMVEGSEEPMDATIDDPVVDDGPKLIPSNEQLREWDMAIVDAGTADRLDQIAAEIRESDMATGFRQALEKTLKKRYNELAKEKK